MIHPKAARKKEKSKAKKIQESVSLTPGKNAEPRQKKERGKKRIERRTDAYMKKGDEKCLSEEQRADKTCTKKIGCRKIFSSIGRE